MFMDDIKIFTENEKELKTLIQIIRIYSQDIWMELESEKYVRLIMNKRNIEITEGKELLNQERIESQRKIKL